MKRRRIKIKFLVFILSIILIVIIAGNYQKTEPPFQQNNKNLENNSPTTATINKEESEEENSDVGSIFKNLIKGIKQQETVGNLIREDPKMNFKELNDRTFLRSKREEIDSWVGKTRKNIEERKAQE